MTAYPHDVPPYDGDVPDNQELRPGGPVAVSDFDAPDLSSAEVLNRIADSLDTLNRGLGAIVLRLERIALAAEAPRNAPVQVIPDQRPVQPVTVQQWDLPAQRATFGAANDGGNPHVCPTHGVPWKNVPGGVSKTTGKPYSAFWACQVRDCKLRPPQGYTGA